MPSNQSGPSKRREKGESAPHAAGATRKPEAASAASPRSSSARGKFVKNAKRPNPTTAAAPAAPEFAPVALPPPPRAPRESRRAQPAPAAAKPASRREREPQASRPAPATERPRRPSAFAPDLVRPVLAGPSEVWRPSQSTTDFPVATPAIAPTPGSTLSPRERRRRNAIARTKAAQEAAKAESKPTVAAPKAKAAPSSKPAAPAPVPEAKSHRKGWGKRDKSAKPQMGDKGVPEPAGNGRSKAAISAPEPKAVKKGWGNREKNLAAPVAAPVEKTPPRPRLTDDAEALADRVLELIREVAPKTLDKVDLTKRLGLKPDARNLVREALRAHEEAGRIIQTSGGAYSLPAAQGLIEGVYVAHEGGFGFVITGEPDSPDIFIPERHSANALHRDRVLVRLRRPRGEDKPRVNAKGKKDKNAPKPRGHDPLPGEKLEGEIMRIVKRANPTLVGTVQKDSRTRHLLLTPDETRISRPIQIIPVPGTSLPDARELSGKKVLVRLLEWDSPWDPLKGELIEVLGDASDPEVALQSLIRKYRLPLEFPDDVQAEANAISATISEKEAKRRLDLREEFIFTIDPDTARDFDDAIHIHRTKDGGYEVGIHIADVSNYVYPGTALDREARVRGNSTYLVDRVIPMIPERLSNGICSLVPNEDRLTRSVLLTADAKGRVINAKFAETVINSKVRLTYRQALALLEHPDRSKISDQVNLAWEFAEKVRGRRFANGALDLDFPDISIILDDEGHPVELRREENDISHQLIEEFMLLANEAVAKTIKEHSLACVYRVHDEPAEEKLAEFRMVLNSYGFNVGDLSQRKELQKFLAQLRGHTEEGALKIALLKSLKRAVYDTKPNGHYGLAKDDYTHFTSPIRRYADLLVHRVLLKLIEKKPTQRQSTLSAGQMAKVAEHISETERIATEAERESKKLKQLEYLQGIIDKAPKGTTPRFEAIVTDIRNFGAFVELPDMLISGLLRGQDLRDWGYFPDPSRGGYVNRRTDTLLRIGSKVTVEVMELDLLRKQVNFHLIQEDGVASSSGGASKPAKTEPAGKHVKPAKARRDESRRGSRR